jgi:serine/threonine protein kinase
VPPGEPDTPPTNPLDGPLRPPVASDFPTLDQFGPDGRVNAPEAHASGSPTGRYRILRPHAYGGLGEVFLAHDEELGRDVALKRLRPRRADDPASRQRFIAEAAVTARLEHPGVVPVHGLVQDAEGRPAYAMRFIQGDTLEDAINQFHGTAADDDGKRSASEIIIGALKGPPAPRFDSLEFRQLLARFVAVCNAIAYAHSRGVIHRDLKPANVMLGPFGETLVVDWGLAKDLESVSRDSGTSADTANHSPSASQPFTLSPSQAVTQAGEILGTPCYMAPEQADGQAVGTAADVYGLGAILYTLLTGAPPVPGGNPREVLDRVRRGAIAPPRAVIPALPRPLDAACRTAMAFDPAARYPSALDLAADIERWLADEPVSADRETRRERVRRWGRRHRPVVAAVAALLVTAVIALGITTVLISRQQAETEGAKKRIEEQKTRADENLQLARQAVGVATTRLIDHPRLQAGDFIDLRSDLLDALMPFYDQLTRQAGEDPATAAGLGQAEGRFGNLRSEMGRIDQAEPAYRRKIAIFTRLADQYPQDPQYRRLLAKGHSDLGVVLGEAGRTDKARDELNEAVRQTRSLAAAAPADPVARQDLAGVLLYYGHALKDVGQLTDAEAAYREALALARGLLAGDTITRTQVSLCAGIENDLGVLLRVARRPAEAEPLFRSAIDRRTLITDSDPTDRINRREMVTSRYNLANLLRVAGQSAAAEAEYRVAIGLAEKLAADFSAVPDYRSDLARVVSSLGMHLGASGRLAEAADLLHRSSDLLDRLAADLPAIARYRHDGAASWYNLGFALQGLQKTAEAEAAYRRAADEYARLAAEAPADAGRVADLAATWVTLGDLAHSNGQWSISLEWYDKSIARLAGAAGDGALRDAHVGRAEALTGMGKTADALAAWDIAIGLADKERLPALRLRRGRGLVAAGDHVRAAAEARAVTAAPDVPADILDVAARVLALAAGAARSDTAAANGYAADAVAHLRRANKAGQYREPGSADKLRGDADFVALRDRDEFGKFLAKVGK